MLGDFCYLSFHGLQTFGYGSVKMNTKLWQGRMARWTMDVVKELGYTTYHAHQSW